MIVSPVPELPHHHTLPFPRPQTPRCHKPISTLGREQPEPEVA